MPRDVKGCRAVLGALVWLGCTLNLPASTVMAEARLGSEWRFEGKERGITISRRERSSHSLSAFKGEGRVQANVLKALAVILDTREVERWAYGVSHARSVKRIDERSELVYLYSDTPWPVRDRDMVVLRTVNIIKPGEEFSVSLRCDPSAAPTRNGIIRVRSCESSFRLRKLDANTTEIVYEMSLDPEGRLPQWASALVTRNAPVKTLLAIEERASRPDNRYASFVRRWSNAM